MFRINFSKIMVIELLFHKDNPYLFKRNTNRHFLCEIKYFNRYVFKQRKSTRKSLKFCTGRFNLLQMLL